MATLILGLSVKCRRMIITRSAHVAFFPFDFITSVHRVLRLLPFPGCIVVLFTSCLSYVYHHLSVVCSPPPSPNVVTKLDPLDHFSFTLFPLLAISVSQFRLFVLTFSTHSDFSSFPESLHLVFPYLSSFGAG
jgi:hypothetical protein